MLDMPLVQSGALISVATSNDEDHPASNVIDGNEQTFWMTTGLFPQSLTISFPQMIEMKSIKFSGFAMKQIIIEKSVRSNPVEFEVVTEKVLKNEDQRLQTNEIKIQSVDARHVKFVIAEAYESFIAIQHIKIEFSKGSR